MRFRRQCLNFIFMESMIYVTEIQHKSNLFPFWLNRNYHRLAYCGRFSVCLSVVYIQYTPSSQTKNRSALCDPAVNIYCRTGSKNNDGRSHSSDRQYELIYCRRFSKQTWGRTPLWCLPFHVLRQLLSGRHGWRERCRSSLRFRP